jgi:hypothetical protein
VEFENREGNFLSLKRHLTGGNVEVYHAPLSRFPPAGKTVVPRRRGKSTAEDVSSVFLPFGGMKEAELRKNKEGRTQRLTVRTLLPIFLVDENSIIAERSPVFGQGGYQHTTYKRMFSYLLTGVDDAGVVAAERRDIAQAQLRAKLALITDLLKPIELRLSGAEPGSSEMRDAAIDQIEVAINEVSESLAVQLADQSRLGNERAEAVVTLQRAEAQVLGAKEMLTRYRLLDERYQSDLERLDFVSEGAHFFNGLQEARCPLCDQPMDEEHRHIFEEHATAQSVYEAARAEAGKILGLRADLANAVETLNSLHNVREGERRTAEDVTPGQP